MSGGVSLTGLPEHIFPLNTNGKVFGLITRVSREGYEPILERLSLSETMTLLQHELLPFRGGWERKAARSLDGTMEL
jgi:hypothetical protein